MRNVFFYFLGLFFFTACNSNDKKQTKKKSEKSEYTITKDGINDLKIGMSQQEVEKLLNTHFDMNAEKDSVGYWSDTIKTKYRDLDVSLYFDRQYVSEDSGYMEVNGIETSSPLCKTASGVGIGDEKSDIIAAYEDNPVNMSPDWVNVNDTTWAMSKTKYSVYVRDDKWDKEIIFHLTNKKVTSLEARIIMGD